MSSQPPEPHSQNWIGQYIGNYRLVRLLGEGSMGIVFEGVHDGVGGRAAIKILRPEITDRGDIAARFFNEARAANASQHPGIVRVFDSGYTPSGVAFLSMEFLDGQTLRARLVEKKTFPVRDALRVGKQIASALLAAHRKNIIHRDLKPDNIMLVADPDLPGGERVKILDFGIAKITESLGAAPINTHSSVVLGTPVYMAPEQCRSAKGVTDRSDVYSLGVILYRMLSGRPPFIGHSTTELLAMHIMDPPPLLRELAPSVGEPVAALIHSMLDKAPAQRPSMELVVEQLQRLEKDPAAVITALPEPVPPPSNAVATVLHEVIVAPTVRAPVIIATTPDAITTRQKVIRKRRKLSAVVKSFAKSVPGARLALWTALFLIAMLAVVGAVVFLLQKPEDAQSPSVEIRHPAATGSPGPETAAKKNPR